MESSQRRRWKAYIDEKRRYIGSTQKMFEFYKCNEVLTAWLNQLLKESTKY